MATAAASASATSSAITNITNISNITTLTAALLLSGCAAFSADPAVATSAAEALAAATPTQWYAPPAHRGEVADLATWWAQFNDPLLARLIDAAQQASPSVSTAGARIAQSRAASVAAGAAALPSVDASATAQRGVFDSSGTISRSASGSVTASWEVDVFGRVAAGRNAADARLTGANAMWHDARVSVAAEVATRYTELRACEAQVDQSRIDATSRAETARLTGLTARAGFESPANAALARASAAQSHAQLTQQRALCEGSVKTLVALTGWAEPALRSALVPATAVIAAPRDIAVPALPAALLAQRPDLLHAERDVVAAAFDIRQRQAERWPRIQLGGSVGETYYSAGSGGGFRGPDGTATTWSIGPVSVSVPVFDGGTQRANIAAARGAHADAIAQYAATLRRAVQEVEQALVTLQSTADQQADAAIAVAGFADSLRATEARFKNGLGTLFELEDARRTAVQAQTTLIGLQRDRVTAWISLYRALGGGWAVDALPVAESAASTLPEPPSPRANREPS